MKEVELKMVASEALSASLPRSPAVLRFGRGEPETRALRTVYLDTEAQSLARAGIALRLRHDGAGWTQTVKAVRRMQGGFSEALESALPRPGPDPDIDAIADAPLREAVIAALAGGVPGPVFETAIERTVRQLHIPHLGIVELASDVGEIRARDRSAPLREIEIELVSGTPRAVFEAARHLLPEAGARLSRLSKAERGALLLAEGVIEPAAAPRLAQAVALDPAMSAEQAARAVLGECLDQILANLDAVARSDDPEGPHQLRVALRRLRSALLVFGPTLAGPALDRLAEAARWLGHEVGAVRDLDVALADILGPELAAETAEPGFRMLAEALARHLATARAHLRETIAGRRAWLFQLDLAEFVAARGWLDPGDWDQTARLARPIGAVAEGALELRLGKVARRGEGIAGLGVEQRHALRKELKKLRYAVEFLSPLYPDRKVRPFLKQLKALQEIFGDMNDAAMAEALFRDPAGPAATDIGAARAAGFVIGVRTERARRSWEDAKAVWKAFRAADPFWR